MKQSYKEVIDRSLRNKTKFRPTSFEESTVIHEVHVLYSNSRVLLHGPYPENYFELVVQKGEICLHLSFVGSGVGPSETESLISHHIHNPSYACREYKSKIQTVDMLSSG